MHPNVGESIEELTRHLQPPLPQEAPTTPPPWDEAPYSLPTDYKRIVERLGGGWVSGMLKIHIPTSKSGFGAFRHRPFDPGLAGPQPENLLLWGSTDDGLRCFWRITDPNPDLWPVEMWSLKGTLHQVDRCDEGMAAFLLAAVKARHPHIPEVFDDPCFIRTEDWVQGFGGAACA